MRHPREEAWCSAYCLVRGILPSYQQSGAVPCLPERSDPDQRCVPAGTRDLEGQICPQGCPALLAHRAAAGDRNRAVEISVALGMKLDSLAFIFGVCGWACSLYNHFCLVRAVWVPCCPLDRGCTAPSSRLPPCIAFGGTPYFCELAEICCQI